MIIDRKTSEDNTDLYGFILDVRVTVIYRYLEHITLALKILHTVIIFGRCLVELISIQ